MGSPMEPLISNSSMSRNSVDFSDIPFESRLGMRPKAERHFLRITKADLQDVTDCLP